MSADIGRGSWQAARRLVRFPLAEGGDGQRQMEGHPVQQYRAADELADRLVCRGSASRSSPETWDELYEAGKKLKGQ